MSVANNLKSVEEKIVAACQYAGVDVVVPRLIAVSKQQPKTAVAAALEAGQRVFGENRVQEAIERWTVFSKDYDGLELHLIGSLQTNKARDAVALFDVIHVLDRPKLAHALAKEMQAQNKTCDVFIQVNLGEEDQKGGVAPDNLLELLTLARDTLGMRVVGLMAIPPADNLAAPYFGLLRKLAERYNLPRLSMGMSTDYDVAAAMGATDIRVGTAIFGERSKHP